MLRQFRAFAAAASIGAFAACASVAPEPPPEALRGCWIERRGAETLTMRWFPEEIGHGWRGDLLTYRPGAAPAAEAFQLSLAAGEDQGMASPVWAICGMTAAPDSACRRVFFRDIRRLREGGGWMELRATADRLVFTLESEAGSVTRFDGARDGCD